MHHGTTMTGSFNKNLAWGAVTGMTWQGTRMWACKFPNLIQCNTSSETLIITIKEIKSMAEDRGNHDRKSE